MFIFFSTLTATHRSVRLRSLHCEECGTDYGYQEVLQAQGQGTAVYGIDKQGARRRAEVEAAENLQKVLASQQHLAAACPSCGAYPPALAKDASMAYAARIRDRLLPWVAGVITLGSIGSLAAYFCSSPTRGYENIYANLILGAVLGIALGAVISVVLYIPASIYCRASSLHHWDMNSDAMRRQRVARPTEPTMLRADIEKLLRELDPKTREQVGALVRWEGDRKL